MQMYALYIRDNSPYVSNCLYYLTIFVLSRFIVFNFNRMANR